MKNGKSTWISLTEIYVYSNGSLREKSFMFEKLRKPGRSPREGKLKKWFSYFIFGSICLVFVFLAPMGTKLIGGGVVGYVGSEPIRSEEFRFVEESIRRQYQSRLDQADEASGLKIQEEIRQKALQYLINLYLIVQGSQEAGFSLSDEELRTEIRSLPVFQQDGRFSYSRYLSFLKSRNWNPSRFEDRIRRDKLAEDWTAVFRKAISSNALEKEKKSQRYRYKVNFRYALLNAGEIEEQNLEPLVKSKNLQEINSFLKKNRVDWKETGGFSLVSAFGIPIAQNQNVMEALIHHLPSKGIIPQLIRQANKIYIVRVLSFKEENISSQERQLENLLSRNFDKSGRLLDSWVNVQRRQSKIKLSEKI